MVAQSVDRWTWPSRILYGLTILFVVTLPHVTGAEPASKKQPDAPGLARWFWQVSVSPDADEEAKRIGRDLSVALWDRSYVWETPRNPGCCLRLEVTGWTPNPGDPGYVINLQAGGGWVQASDVEQLQLAVEQLKKSIVMKDGKPHLPLGLRTNYPLAPAQ